MLGLKSIVERLSKTEWVDSESVYYRDIAGAKQLCETFYFTLPVAPGYPGRLGFISFDAEGHVTVEPGYCWDGASGPTVDTPDSVRGSLGHDVQYELMAHGLLAIKLHKDAADLWMYKTLLADGMPDFRAWYWYKGVYIAGVPKLDRYDEIKRAPVPFQKQAKPTLEVIPGFKIPA
jgi:hypothetical protein